MSIGSESRPIILDLYREKTQIRLRIYNTDTIFWENTIILIFSSFSYNSIISHCSEITQIKEYSVA